MIFQLTEEQVNENKETFISLLKEIKRETCNIDGLIKKLESSDFFTAPASTKYHCAYVGGLVDHCLNVYYNLKSLAERKHFEVDPDSLIIVALLHDFSKMNFYESYSRNVKKYDDQGKFEWTTEHAYKVRDNKDRFFFADHGQTACFMARQFIPLTLEEEVAIINHMGLTKDCNTMDLTAIFNEYPLATLLHAADFISTMYDERI